MQKGCLSDALPKAAPVTSDIKGSGDPFGMRSSVSCNDITREENGSKETEKIDKHLPDQMSASTKSIPRFFGTSVDGPKPGMIVARSSEVISVDNREDSLAGEFSFRAWNSLCTIPTSSIPTLSSVTHPFSGLLTSQLQCTNCNWKVSGFGIYWFKI